MICPTGPIRQLGLVVADAEAAMAHWTRTLGAGPFFVNRHLRFEDFVYRGKASPSPLVTLCFAQIGDLQIEIIEQHDDAPSVYRDFISAGHEGLQHVACWFDDNPGFDAACRDLGDGGMHLAQSGKAQGLDVRFAYYAPADGGLPQLELAQATKPEVIGFAKAVAAASVGWNGRDPVRPVTSILK